MTRSATGKLYIKGLVKVADSVRRSMAGPVSAGRKAELCSRVADALGQVDAILAAHDGAVEQLPLPTRRAYRFLQQLDFDRLPVGATAVTDARAPGTITVRGLTAFWEKVLGQLARLPDHEEIAPCHEAIAAKGEEVSRDLLRRDLEPQDLKCPSLRAFVWLRYFSARERLDAYVAALCRGKPIMEARVGASGRFGGPVEIAFRPQAHLYRMRGNRHGVRIQLPVPMITFGEGLFEALALFMLGGGSGRGVLEAMQGSNCRAIQASMDALGGVREQAAGVEHDLGQSFDRVVAAYFEPGMGRPRLTWNRTWTGRKFGHYEASTDTVMISCTLDDPRIPVFVVDFVMYHELLHKKLGVRWRGDRQHTHTAQFRAEERRFERYAEAEAALRAIARRHA